MLMLKMAWPPALTRVGTQYRAENISLFTSDIQQAGCQRKMCWETSVGIEFYKLTVFDIFIQFAVVLLMDIPR